MFKKSLTMALSVIMILGMGTTSLAADTMDAAEKNAETTIDTLIDELNAIQFDRDVTFTALPKSQSSDPNLLKFNSVEEVEMFLKQFMADSRELAIPTGTVQQSQPQLNMESCAASMDATYRDGTYNTTVKWWGGGNTSLLSMTNAAIQYDYHRGRVSKIIVKDSYMRGITGASWTHRSGSGIPLGGMNTRYSVTGTWTINYDLKGFTVGTSFNETLKSPTITLIEP